MASTQLITDIKSAISTGPSADSKKAAIDPDGPIQGLEDMMQSVQVTLEEAAVKMASIMKVIDSGDGIKTTLQGIVDSLD